MTELPVNKSGRCRCFAVDPRDVDVFRRRLTEAGLEPRPAGGGDHKRAFGLRFRLKDLLQIHLEVAPSGTIEAVLEPPPECPRARPGPVRGYPAHDAIPSLLDIMGVEYTGAGPVPDSCRLPTVIKPDRPLEWWEVLVVGVATAGLSVLLYHTVRDMRGIPDPRLLNSGQGAGGASARRQSFSGRSSSIFLDVAGDISTPEPSGA